MIRYNWTVWKNCRIAGYILAYSEWDAMKMAQKKYGDNIFVERHSWGVSSNPTDLAGVAVVSTKLKSKA